MPIRRRSVSAPVRKPLDPALDEVAQQVAQPQLVIVTSREKVDQIVHGRGHQTALARWYRPSVVFTRIFDECSCVRPPLHATRSTAKNRAASSIVTTRPGTSSNSL